MATYTLLGGARANVGDHLIVDRAKKLLNKHIDDLDLIELSRWEPLDKHLDVINDSHGLILCGGPAYQANLYPGIYPLVDDLSRIKVPIIPFGLGWKGVPGDERTVREYRFSKSSMKLLRRMHENCEFTSCRDYLTQKVLERAGFVNVIMTGDPAWYDLDYLWNDPPVFDEIDVIALSTPAKVIFHDQCVELADQCQRLFPHARLVCTFHHGWEESSFVGKHFSEQLCVLERRLSERGYEVMDLSGDLQRMEDVYSEADIHVGYRLHAHLFCLSRQKPSFLLEEDGRGRGAAEALGMRSIPAWTRTTIDSMLGELPIGNNGRRAVRRILKAGWKARGNAVEKIVETMQKDESNGFARFQKVHQVIVHSYREALIPFLEAIPGRTK